MIELQKDLQVRRSQTAKVNTACGGMLHVTVC